MKKEQTEKERQFMDMIERNGSIISRVCYVYSQGRDHFNDLYQETLANLWQGFGRFRGESAESTWIYRVTLNTCITYYRRNSRHYGALPLDALYNVAEEVSTRNEDIKELYRLISCLGKLDRAIIMLWLDEKSYDEIAEITGLTRANIATRIHRIKNRLMTEAENE